MHVVATYTKILKIRPFRKYFQRNMASGLAYIDIPESSGPFELFRNWLEDFKKQTASNFVVFNLATSSTTGDVKNRYIALQELAEDGLIFNCNLNSPKAKQIAENPKVAASFIFQYSTDDVQGITRQVRIEGVAEKWSPEAIERQYNSQPLYAKIRSSLIPEQGVEVKWDDLRRKHQELLEKVTNGELELKMPDYFVVYKIVPKLFDFYHAAGQEIADRILFKENTSGSWRRCHITA